MHVSKDFGRSLWLLWGHNDGSNANSDVERHLRDVLFNADPPELLIHRGNLLENAVLQSLLAMLTSQIKKDKRLPRPMFGVVTERWKGVQILDVMAPSTRFVIANISCQHNDSVHCPVSSL